MVGLLFTGECGWLPFGDYLHYTFIGFNYAIDRLQFGVSPSSYHKNPIQYHPVQLFGYLMMLSDAT